MFSCKYSEEEILENEIYSCFFMTEFIQRKYTEYEKEYGTLQNTNPTFSILEIEIPPPLLDLAGKINFIC